MAIEPARFFSPDPADARSMKGIDLVELFNDGLAGFSNKLAPAPEVDLDGADEFSFQRSSEQALFDEQTSENQRREDEALFLSRQAPVTDYQSESEEQSYSAPSTSYAVAPSSQEPAYEGPSDLIGLVKELEGFNPKAYGDYKQTSIGYGTRAKKGETSISKEEADRRLRSELAVSRNRVLEHAKKHGYDFSENQVNALTSFDYNTGRLEQLTNNGTRPIEVIAERIPLYKKAGGKDLPGLVKRRRTEQQLFNQR